MIHDPQRPPRLRRWAWLPSLFFLLALGALWAADPRASNEPRGMRWGMNVFCAGLASLGIAYLARRRLRNPCRGCRTQPVAHDREPAVRDREQRMQQALRGGRSFTFDWDLKTDWILRSNSSGAILGLTGDHAINDTGRRHVQRIHPDDRTRVEHILRGLTPAAGEYTTDYRVARADGSEVVLEEIGQGAFDAAGRLTRLVGVATDIAGRTRAEEAVRQAAADIEAVNADLRDARRAALNLMDDAIEARERTEWLARFPKEDPSPVLRVATDGIVLYRNPAAAERAGWTCEVGQPAPPALRALVDRAVAMRQPLASDVDLGGSTYAVTVALFPEARYANVYGRDVTEERRAQENAWRAKQEWERTFDSVPDLIAILDADRRIVRVNRALAERLGKTPAQCVGLGCCDIMHGYGAPVAGCPHRLTLADGKDHSLELWEQSLRADFLITTSPLRDAADRIIGSVHVARDITERKRAERREQEARALAAASRTATDILESMGEGVLLLDMEGRILSGNPALTRMTGIPAEEYVGRLVRELLCGVLAPDEQALTAAALAEMLDGRVSSLPAVTVLNRGGARIPVIPSVAFVREPGGEPSAIVVTLRDVSELRSLERSAEESHALLERIFDNTHMCIAYLDRDFNFVRVNRAFADSWRLGPDFFPGKNLFALTSHAENEAIFREVAETGGMFVAHEKPFEFPDHPEWGVTYWDWTLRPLKGAHDRVESLLYCLLDVTARVRARRELVESERKYRELVEKANSIIMRITPNHDIIFFNEYAERFFGYAEAEVLGRNVLGTIIPETSSAGRDMRAMMKDITAHPEHHGSHENENMCKDGRRVWVHWANQAVRDDKGNLIEILCVGTDITRRREMEAEASRYQHRLRDLAERLAASEEEDRWRISRYIHDTIIQNLSLASIRLGALEQPMVGARLHEETEKMRRIRGLLEEACSECRTVMADLTPVLLYELGLVPALNDLAQQLKMKHGARILVEDGGEERSLSNPLRGLLFDSVRELVMNALKYAGPCDIRVALSSCDVGLSVTVEDNGAGFDPRAHAERDRQGGFGLFNIRQRLEGLGGRLEIETAPGKGTRATITVPAEPGGGQSGPIPVRRRAEV